MTTTWTVVDHHITITVIILIIIMIVFVQSGNPLFAGSSGGSSSCGCSDRQGCDLSLDGSGRVILMCRIIFFSPGRGGGFVGYGWFGMIHIHPDNRGMCWWWWWWCGQLQ